MSAPQPAMLSLCIRGVQQEGTERVGSGWALYTGIQWGPAAEGTQATMMGTNERKMSNYCAQGTCTPRMKHTSATHLKEHQLQKISNRFILDETFRGVYKELNM